MWLKFFLNCCALLPLVPAIVFMRTQHKAYLLLSVALQELSENAIVRREKAYAAASKQLNKMVLFGAIGSCLLFTLVHFLLP